ncbi:bifunctional metallophosphatase/5'-nucleotidase [Anaeromicropila herbilytica]|uniref:Metallophosphatase n=1 Tax=Anaeromicropila herbilytica TaxID=2785025 RepID=A0A7R7EPY1_9FIRM|nr:bifunctional UDP-sugar hydrolase/5'-nucleotidase [Anaeromicropila herbilytica]BCN32891.1 metallophosphatase [Anaeromicropila herbilytica]
MKIKSRLQKVVVTVLAVALMFGMSGLPVQTLQAADTTTTTQTTTPVSTEPANGVSKGDIVILYDNDVHCAVDGYASISSLKKDMKGKTKYVSVVSNGDFVQGATIGALSKGENIVKIMNKVGYDVVTLGNHEFDYQIKQLTALTKELKSKVVSCNFMNLKTNKPVYKGYTMKTYGDKKVAYVGITTPESITKSTPTYFQDKNGKYIYGFCSDTTGKALYQRVQKTVNEARKAGADYVVALAHLGTEGVESRWSSTSVIKNTTGIDVVLDGHSHSTIPEDFVDNKDGYQVVLSSTGTKFANIGELVIENDGDITTDLVPVKQYTKTDDTVKAYIDSIKEEYQAQISKVIGKTTVDLTTLDVTTNKRAVRSSETNLGDFCADALRNVLDADVAIMNGGGIRANIAKGDVTYNDLLSVFPWSNMGCVVEATGQQIKDALEMGARNYPEENGGFLQVSGMTYEINKSVPTSVKLDASGMFVSVGGQYRVQNVKVLNSKTGKYEDLDLAKTYKLAGINYTLKSCGDGYTMFKSNKILKDEVAVDNEILITYLTNNLKGVVGNEYANPAGQGRIVIK